MKRRLLSLFLAFVTILSLLPTAAFAASSEEDALGEVDIYNGDYELGYLAINGAVKKQKYTYFLYESNDGSTKESPAYCVNPNQYGVPQTVGPGESIKYLANEKASDPKVVGIISNGYPHRSLGELGLENKYQAFYATKMALWCYLIPSWDISNLKVAPGLSGDEQDRGNRILAAAKDLLGAIKAPLAEVKSTQQAVLEQNQDYLSRGALKQLEDRNKRELNARERSGIMEALASVR